MLGVWEQPKEEIETRHFAFRCDRDFLVDEARDFLRSHGLSPLNFLNDGTEDPTDHGIVSYERWLALEGGRV